MSTIFIPRNKFLHLIDDAIQELHAQEELDKVQLLYYLNLEQSIQDKAMTHLEIVNDEESSCK